MCGIAGFWDQPGPEDAFTPVLKRMAASLRHRGPDSSGLWFDQRAGIGFAHTRLAIVDLSPAGHQPMHSNDARWTITFNGEVYNFEAIRRELDAAGLAPSGGWRGHSDTEIILAAVSGWGVERALSRFVGMFAMALWDHRERELWLIRDRLGIKPLYYGFCGTTLVFASELKALRALSSWRGEVDARALALYLRYLYVPAPLSIWQGVQKLLPGAWLRITAADMEQRRVPEPVRYWRVEDAVAAGLADPFAGSEAELVRELDQRLSNAVGLRLVADVPLGAFLSGGIDSSTVVALMQAQSSQPVRTYSIGTHSSDYNEAEQAKAVARHLGTAHTELYVEPEQALAVVPLLPEHYDEPYADISQIPTLLVSRLARRDVTVSLSGDGGDELFGGYTRYLQGPGLWRRMSRLPLPLRRLVAGALRHGGEAGLDAVYRAVAPLLPPERRQTLFRDKIQKVTEGLCAPHGPGFYRALTSLWHNPGQLLQSERCASPPPLAPGLFGLPLHPADDGQNCGLPAGMDYAAWMMAADQTSYLPDDILTKLDRASMAVSLEARVPLLDHRVVEFAWRIPPGLTFRAGRGKHALRRVLETYVPPALTDRPKQGFDLPLDAWLRGPLRGWAEELLDAREMQRQGYLNPEPVRQAWTAHLSGRRNLQHQLWGVLMFQAWRARYGA